VTISANARLLARYDSSAGGWRIRPGGYTVAVATSAVTPRLAATVELTGRTFGR